MSSDALNSDGTAPAITIYGTATCADCRRSRALLDDKGVNYTWVDLGESADAAEYVVRVNGRTSTPFIEFSDGTNLTEPSDVALTAKLIDLGLVAGS